MASLKLGSRTVTVPPHGHTAIAWITGHGVPTVTAPAPDGHVLATVVPATIFDLANPYS